MTAPEKKQIGRQNPAGRPLYVSIRITIRAPNFVCSLLRQHDYVTKQAGQPAALPSASAQQRESRRSQRGCVAPTPGLPLRNAKLREGVMTSSCPTVCL